MGKVRCVGWLWNHWSFVNFDVSAAV